MQYICSCWLVLTSEGRGAKRVSFEWFSRIYSERDPTEPVDPENPDPEKPVKPPIRQTQKVPILVPKDRCLLIMLQVLTLGKIVFRIKTKYILQEHSNIKKIKKKHQILCKFLIIEEPIAVGL